MEESIFGPVSKKAGMRKTGWTTLEDILRPIRKAKEYGLDERIRRTNEHLVSVVESPSYPKPITDAMVNQAIALAREGFEGSLIERIVDPRAR